ncbi:MAG: hypothetical protein ABSG67_15470 [Thermoguttaceae bacterium]
MSVLTAAGTVHAQTAWYEGFEGAEISWRDAGGDAQYRILDHRRVQNEAHTGKGCEWLRLSGNGGSYVYIAHDVGRPIVIDELMPSLWIKSDRSGLQLLARLVLPRTIDSKTGRPVSTLVAGTSYTDAGRWQELRITDMPRLLARQIRFLRSQTSTNVDGREAYIDAVLLNVYGGPGVTNVWIDDLDVAGYVSASAPPQAQTVTPLPPIGNNAASGNTAWMPKGSGAPASAAGSVAGNPASDPAFAAAGSYMDNHRQDARATQGFAGNDLSRTPPIVTIQPKRHEVKLSGSVLTVDSRPFFSRAIEHQGEPLAVLKQLGFNTVWLKRLPAQEILEEADRLGLWVICPPPSPPRADGVSDPAAVLSDVGPAFDPVLIWDLSGDLSPGATGVLPVPSGATGYLPVSQRLETTRRWAEQIRNADHRGERPLICRPSADLRGYSRLDSAMILLIDRRPLGTSMELTDYGTWVGRQPLLARPGTSVWTTIQTQVNESLRQQIAALEPGNATPLEISFEQMQLMALTAITAKSRGLLFLSSSPLDANDTETRHRAIALQLLNLELELIEPWAAAGDSVTTCKSSEKDVVTAMLQAERARLLLPIWYSPGAQCAPAQSAAKNLTLVAPGVPESAGAFELNPSGIKPLPHKRVDGGMRVILGEFDLTAQTLLAQDPLIVNNITRRWAVIGPQAAQLEHDLAVHDFYTVQKIAGQLDERPGAKTPPPALLDDARKSLQSCDTQMAARQYAAAKLAADQAMSSLRAIQRFYWDDAVDDKKLASPVTSPAALGFQTLPSHFRLVDRIRAARFGPNLLPGGDFENLDMMFQTGWRYLKTPLPGVQTAADLLAGSAHSGAFGLRLSVTADDLKHPPAMLESPPIRFVSPSIMLEAGQIVCIHGWVNVPSPITGSVDGLMIFDSTGGEALADRVGHSTGWRQFALYRIAPQSAAMNVTFALTGLGEAWIDDVYIQVLDVQPPTFTAR